MFLPILIGSLGAMAAISAIDTGDHEVTRLPQQPVAPPPATHPEQVPPHVALPTPQEAVDIREVMDAYVDEIAAQSDARMASAMASIARRTLTNHQRGWSSIVMPCDQRLHKALPDPAYLKRIASTLAESYEVGMVAYPARWSHPKLGSVGVCAVVFYPKEGMPPTREEALHPMAEALRTLVSRGEFIEYGANEQFGILDLIVNTIIASSVGTVTSMGTQSLIRSAGGERRLARLVRRYKRAKTVGDTGRARRIQSKITRSASRLKGRHVDWSEIEQLVGESPI